MRTPFLLRTLLFSTIVFCITASCGNHSTNNAATTDTGKTATTAAPGQAQQSANTPTAQPVYKPPTAAENKFKDLRTTAFTTNPNDLKIKIANTSDVVYGVVFDQNINGVTTTLTGFETGAANLYQSTGGSISGGKHANVSDAAKQLVTLAQGYISKAAKARETTIPDKGMVKFYLLTNKGIYVADEDAKNLANHSSPLSALFDEGNKVIAQLKSIK